MTMTRLMILWMVVNYPAHIMVLSKNINSHMIEGHITMMKIPITMTANVLYL